jgi:hypothetical protein
MGLSAQTRLQGLPEIRDTTFHDGVNVMRFDSFPPPPNKERARHDGERR